MKCKWNPLAAVVAAMLIGGLALAASPAQAASSEGVVNINTATAKQLQVLKGVGAKKAQAIVEYRASRPFASVEELIKVKGIGQKLFDQLRPYLTVKGETTLKPSPKKRRAKK